MPTRPLPALTPETEFFWTGGAQAELRFQRCTACGRLRHPPLPVCPYCHASETEIVAVAGRGTVAGVTVNYQAWLPDFPPPYAIAIVAIDEDPDVRLTTNIVNCPPEDVFVGMRVKVLFEQHEDVWLPLFEPTGQPEPGPVPKDRDLHAPVRPMVSTHKFERDSAITGVGMSRIGRRLMVDPLALTVEASLAALEDAGLELEDIDGLSTYPAGAAAGGHSEGGVTALEGALRIRPTWINGAPETPGQSGAIVAAMLAVSAGLCRHVLCFRTVWEATSAALARAGEGAPPRRIAEPLGVWRFPYGAMSAANWIGMFASNYFKRYGVTRETLGWIAVTERANAALNPRAIYRDPITIEDYLLARMVSTPFGLLDCDVPCDGSVAVIVSAIDAARDLRHRPVLFEAVGTRITERLSWDQGTLSHEPQLAGPSAHMWSRTELRRSDVDVALLYDGFTFNCLSWLEALGFCGEGEAAGFLEGGHRIALNGELPLNPHGGQLSAGRTHGFGFVHEAVVQLRGDGGARQVANAEVAVVSTGGGTPGGALLLTRDR